MSLQFRWLISLIALSLVVVGCAEAPAWEERATSEARVTDTSGARVAASDLAAATEKKEEADIRIGRVMGRMNGLLTAPQQASFVAAFNKLDDVKKIEADYQDKSLALATELDKIKADPEAIQTYGARKLFEAYQEVAKTPQALVSLKVGTDLVARRVVLAGVSTEDAQDLIGQSLAGAFLRNLLVSGSVPTATQQTISVLETGNGYALQVAGWLQKYNAFHETDALAASLSITSDKTIASLRTVAGIIAIWKVGDDIARGDADALIKDFFSSAPTAVTGVASATALFRRMILGIETTPLASSVIKWSGKIATAIGIVTSALALWNDAGKWNDSLDNKVRVVADVLAIGAGILVLAGAGPIGPILATVSFGLTFYADWLKERRLEAQEEADLTACLPATDIDVDVVQTILVSHPALLRVIVQDVKLSPEDIQWLLAVDPTVASVDAGPPLQFIGMRIVQKVFDLDAKETGALLKAVRGTQSGDDGALQLDTFFRMTDFGYLRGDMTRAEALDWFTKDAVSATMSEPRLSRATAAAANARTYLAAAN